MNTETLKDFEAEIISQLAANQQPTGEFMTTASTNDGHDFYIGKSPFATAHIIYLLSLIDNAKVKDIVNKGISFLESLDSDGLRLYRFWYPTQVYNTNYPVLAYDMDDIAVVNSVLKIHSRKSIELFIINNNLDSNANYYTWLHPSANSILKKPMLAYSFLKNWKSYAMFTKKSAGINLASYNDSELIVEMNIEIYRSICGATPILGEKKLIIDISEVLEELFKSHYYNNEAMYYLTLTKLQVHTGLLPMDKVLQLQKTLLKEILNASLAKMLTYYLSLILTNFKLDEHQKSSILQLFQDGAYNDRFEICVGNKRTSTYHTYWSSDITRSIALVIISFLKNNIKAQ